VSDSLYAYSVLHFLQEHSSAAGVVIDLRDNTGGNMYPMISAVSPLLPDGIILEFKGKKRTSPISLDFVLRVVGINAPEIRKFPEGTPVAILTNDMTASSGEATLLCFRGLDNTRTFGRPTAGFASANQPFPLKNGYSLVLTTGCDVARTGEVFCDDPIAPDVETETPLEDAVSWIQSTK
jgi:C-terminal processing protease CtpA/Prc